MKKELFLVLRYKPSKISLELSKLKAQSVNIKNTLVVGSDTVIDLGGKTTLFDLAALIEGAKFFVGLDSVASHIAAAVNTPGVTLFGPSKSENWRPWSEKIGVISRKGDEQLCSIHGHLKGKSKNCLCYITPEMVIQSLDKVVN